MVDGVMHGFSIYIYIYIARYTDATGYDEKSPIKLFKESVVLCVLMHFNSKSTIVFYKRFVESPSVILKNE